MSKRSVFTTITPIPAGITRDLVLKTLHSHLEMIDLNPLVVHREPCKAPSFASAEDFFRTWYVLKDKISYLPGGLATGEVSYFGCFHDLPNGLQTHVFAPLGLEIKGKWTVGGSLPGEPKEPPELGLEIPRDGLYLREDVDMKCNFLMTSFVKKTLKKSHASLVDRMVEKANAASGRNPSTQALPGAPEGSSADASYRYPPPVGSGASSLHRNMCNRDAGNDQIYTAGDLTASSTIGPQPYLPSSNTFQPAELPYHGHATSSPSREHLQSSEGNRPPSSTTPVGAPRHVQSGPAELEG